MPTPASGQISMNDMRTHINRATSSSISMSEMRTRYGGSGQISFSDLRNAEGFTINPARYYASSKYFSANNDGWSVQSSLVGVMGSISPNESNGMVQFAAASFLVNVYEDNLYDPGNTVLGFRENNDPNDFPGNNSNITAGYRGGNVTRVVLANTSYSVISSANNYAVVTYNMPITGTIHCLVKF